MNVESIQPKGLIVEAPSFRGLADDAWAGFAAMLVALPSSMAYGVAAYSVFGPEYIAQGAIAGIVGAAVLGLIAPLVGGAPRLVSAPCAPAAAMITVLAVQLVAGHPGRQLQPPEILLLLSLVAMTAGVLQIGFGVLGAGQLIKYIPFPVIAGYLSAVGLLILIGQVPSFLGLAKGISLWKGLMTPGLWQWPSLVIGGVTIVAMLSAPKITRALPAPIFGLLGGVLAFTGMTLLLPDFVQRNHQSMVVGSVSGGISTVRFMFVSRWLVFGRLTLADLSDLVAQPITLAILLSIDTLKTCVIVDTLTRSRHNSNRELVGQGTANVISALLCGLPGGGVSGATLVSVNSGSKSRFAGAMEGVFVLVAFLVFGKAIGQIPVAVLAGILIVVAVRMIDHNSFALLRQTSTFLDFLIIVTVVVVAVRFDLIVAAGVGLGLSILLFIREQVHGTVIRRKLHGDQISSKQQRLAGERESLQKHGAWITVCQLQGSLFFGTTDQLFNELEVDLKQGLYVILEMARVQSVDFTAAHMLQQIEAILQERNGQLIFCALPLNLPTGQDLAMYFRQVELIAPTYPIKICDTLDEAVEWAENQILDLVHAKSCRDDRPLELEETELLRGIDTKALAALESCVDRRSYRTGEKIFTMGDSGDELFLIRMGSVRISLPLVGGRHYNITTFTRGDFFGDMAFLDRGVRSADAVAEGRTELFSISRSRFDEVVKHEPMTGNDVFSFLARALAIRLRYADSELRALQDS